jgi:xylulokinase
MIALAQSASAGSENLFFLPYLTGERCPHPNPHARGCFIGLTPRHSMAHIVRATLEGITMGMREQVDIMRAMGIPIAQVRASGGGARSEFWRQLQADMYQAPVVTINVSEGAALGAAILAGVGHGEWNTVAEATAQIIKIKDRSRPNAKRAAMYESHHQKFAMLYPALHNCFAAIG